MRITLTTSCLLLAAFAMIPACQRHPEAIRITNLETHIPRLMEEDGIPGLSIALVQHGEIVWSKGFGIKNVDTGGAVTDTTVFEAASLTKPLFAYAVLKMVDEGLIELDVPLMEYVPADRIEEKILRHPMKREGFNREWFVRITARMVLSHTSGLPHGERGEVYPILFEPGTQYRYSAQGYYFLQLVVEHLTGKPLRDLMEDYVLGPLGMKHSSFVWRDEYEHQSAAGHSLFGEVEEFRKRARGHAAASLYTTAPDYARFVIAILRGQGLKPETYRDMLGRRVDVDPGTFWSLGFGLEESEGGCRFWQWGDYIIFRNFMMGDPASGAGVVYFTNSPFGLAICGDILELSLGGEHPALTCREMRGYDSGLTRFFRSYLTGGLAEAVGFYRGARVEDPDAFDEGSMNWAGYAFLGAGKTEEAIEIFRLNAEAYPESWNVWDSLAEGYMENGDRDTAIQYYEKSIEMNPENTNGMKMLEKLRAGE